jgi:hypothetical protein
MRLEAIGTPFTYRWPGGEVHFEPGKPVDLPEARALRLLDKAAGRVRVIVSTIQAGDRIEWKRADSAQDGVVDTIYTDDTGTRWAFVTLGESWAVINLKFAKGVPA